MRNKIKTGIPGLDEMMGGGLPEGSISVVSGPPGIGKSTIAMQYIYNGITLYDEAGVYITVEDMVNDVKEYASGFGWNIEDYEKGGKMSIVGREIFEGADMDLGMDLGILRDIIKDIGAKRIVLDSVTLFSYLFKDETTRRLHMLRFLELMKKSGCTTLMTGEQHGNFSDMKYGSEHFLSEGLLMLFWSRYKANNERCIWVVKMKGSCITSDIRPMKIGSEGIVVYKDETPFTMLKAGDKSIDI